MFWNVRATPVSYTNLDVYKRQVLVPVQCEYFALEGMEQLFHTIGLVQNNLNADLQIEGVVFTMYDSRTNLSIEVVEEVKKVLKPDMYSAIIPRNVRLGEAPSYGLPITIDVYKRQV